jgi:hypothetical protein
VKTNRRLERGNGTSGYWDYDPKKLGKSKAWLRDPAGRSGAEKDTGVEPKKGVRSTDALVLNQLTAEALKT